MRSLTRERLLTEHRSVLEEIRRFDLRPGEDAAPESAEIRGALAFLRQELDALMAVGGDWSLPAPAGTL